MGADEMHRRENSPFLNSTTPSTPPREDHLTRKRAGKAYPSMYPWKSPFPHTWARQAVLSPAHCAELWPRAQPPLPRAQTQPALPSWRRQA